jgi:hypothetical protein
VRQGSWWIAVTAALWFGTPAAADLGAPVAGGRAGAFEVQVLVAPAPLRAGPSEWNVLVSEAEGGPLRLDADVALTLRPAEPHGSMHGDGHATAPGVLRLQADPAQADNGLFHAAFVDLPTPGVWNASVEVHRGGATGAFAFDLTVAPAASPILDHWHAFAIVPGGVALLFLHHTLRRRTGRRIGSGDA